MSLIGAIRHVGQAASAIVTDVWAAATRTLTAFTGQPRTDLVGSNTTIWAHVTRPLDLPNPATVYPGAALVSSASADTFGSWVEVIANVGTGKRLAYAQVTGLGAANLAFEVEFGEGAAPNEARITACGGKTQWESAFTGPDPVFVFPLWKSLTDNARLSARARQNNAVAVNFRVTVFVA